MSKNRCYLCGGKLLNGRCQDCGLDNAGSQIKKYRLNQSSLDDERYRKQEEKETAGDKETLHSSISAPDAQKADLQEDSSGSKANVSGLKKKQERASDTKKRYKLIMAVLGVIAVLIGVLPDLISGHKTEVIQVTEEDITQVEEHNPYGHVTRDLATEGDFFEKELTSGEYRVGVHLPEGKYQAVLVEGNGTVTVNDNENSIYLWQSMGKDEENGELVEWEDVRLYQGAKLEVNGDFRVRLSTESAQNAKMAALQANPVSENFLLKRGDEVTAGVDFPEGVYDLESISEWSSVTCRIPLHTDYDDEELNFLDKSVLITTDALDSTYFNIVIPAGTTVISTDADVKMVPSEWIETEDYDSYYDEYRY